MLYPPVTQHTCFLVGTQDQAMDTRQGQKWLAGKKVVGWCLMMPIQCQVEISMPDSQWHREMSNLMTVLFDPETETHRRKTS